MAKKSNAKKIIGRKKAAPVARRPAKPSGKPAAKAAATAPKAKTVLKIKSPLSKTELDMFRQMLLDKRRGLLGDMSGIEAEALRTNRQDGSGDLSNMPTHPADIGTDNFEQEFTLGLLESERTLLTEINSALDRIDAGTYGVCLGTGKPIGVARLKARPWAKYCIEYAKLLEKGLAKPPDEETGVTGGDGQDDEAPVPEEAPEEEEEFVEEEPEE